VYLGATVLRLKPIYGSDLFSLTSMIVGLIIYNHEKMFTSNSSDISVDAEIQG